MAKLFTATSLLLILFFAMLILAGPIIAYAQGEMNFIEIENPLKHDTIEGILKAITGLLKTIALPLAIIIIVWGGIQIMIAGGSEEKLAQGKKAITWAVVGYAIIFLVDFIVGFVKELLGG